MAIAKGHPSDGRAAALMVETGERERADGIGWTKERKGVRLAKKERGGGQFSDGDSGDGGGCCSAAMRSYVRDGLEKEIERSF